MNIQDSRSVTDFQKFTFSGHSRSQVLKSLSESLKLGHADYACFWSLELLCSGLVHSLWQSFFDCCVQHIHRLCPNSVLYVASAYEKFAGIEEQYSLHQMTQIRNREDARDLVCRTASVLSLCRKDKPISLPKIKPEHDFTQQTMREMMKATTQHSSARVIKSEDPFELAIAVNELCYHLQPNVRDHGRTLYWIAWILAYCREQKKASKQTVNFTSRPNDYVSSKFSQHPIWLFWEAVLDAAEHSPQSGTIMPYVDALYRMHNLRWTPGDFKARLPFLFCAIQYVCESNSLDFFGPANQHPSAVEVNLENIPRWLETILQTRDSFSSR